MRFIFFFGVIALNLQIQILQIVGFTLIFLFLRHTQDFVLSGYVKSIPHKYINISTLVGNMFVWPGIMAPASGFLIFFCTVLWFPEENKNQCQTAVSLVLFSCGIIDIIILSCTVFTHFLSSSKVSYYNSLSSDVTVAPKRPHNEAVTGTGHLPHPHAELKKTKLQTSNFLPRCSDVKVYSRVWDSLDRLSRFLLVWKEKLSLDQ